MITAAIGEHAKLAVSGRREGEADFVSQRARVGGEVMFGTAVAMCFRVETSVLDIDTHGQPDITLLRQVFT